MPDRLPLSTLHPQKILVRGVNWVGDAVLTTPALQRLRERFPEAHITLLTHEKLADLWLRHPSLDEVMTFATGESIFSVAIKIRAWRFFREAAERIPGKTGAGERNLFAAAVEWFNQSGSAKREDSDAAFDLALVLPNSPRSALEVLLARVPRRIGYVRAYWNCFLTAAVARPASHIRMRKRSPNEIKRLIRAAPDTTHHTPRSHYPAGAHQIHDYLHLVGALGADTRPIPPKLEVSAAEVKHAEDALRIEIQSRGFFLPSTQPVFLGINPGAEYGPAKRWPAESYVAVAREISRRVENGLWLVFGGPKDRSLGEEIARKIPRALNLAGKTSLRELMASLKLCRVLLTNDTGPMHVAAALETPVVALFGSTASELTGPGLPGDARHRLLQSEVPCAPCFRRTCPIDFRCMAGISVERVTEAVLQAAGH